MTDSTKLSTNINLTRLLTKFQSDTIWGVLARGGSSAFIITVTGYGLAFGTQLLLTRFMGADHYGVYIYVLAWINILVLIAKLGLDTALLRYVAAYKAEESWGALRGILQRSNYFILLASLGLSLVGIGLTWTLRSQLEPELIYTFWVGYALLPILALSGLRQAALRSLKHIMLAKLPESILQPTLLALFIGMAYVGFSDLVSGPTAMMLNFLAALITFLVGTYWLQQNLPLPVRRDVPVYHDREWISVALPLLLVSSTFLFLNRTDILMIGFFLDTTQAGIYAVATRVSTLILFGLTAMSTIAAPMISELFTQNRMKQLQQVVTMTVWGALAFCLPVVTILFIWGEWVLGLFGPTFVVGYSALIILIMAQLINAVTGPVGHMMSMTGHQNQLVLILGVALLINIVLNYTLIPLFGIAGAALATAVTNTGWNIVATLFVYQRLQINCSIFAKLSLK